MIPAPETLYGESNITPAIFWRGASPRALLTSTTCLRLGPGFDATQPMKVVRETNKATGSSIRGQSAVGTLGGFQERTTRAKEGIRNEGDQGRGGGRKESGNCFI